MKLFFLFALLISSTLTYSQNQELDQIPISYYLLTRPLILEGEILELEGQRITISIKSVIKGELKSKKLKIRTKGIFGGTLNQLGLEQHENYVFILARKGRLRDYLMYYPYQRMKIQNDSLFIPENNLTGIEKNSTINIHQPNTFDDPVFKAGYKISTADFSQLVTELNETFQVINYGENRYVRRKIWSRCYWKKKEIDTTTTAFNLALLNQINGWWEIQMCEK